MSKLKFLFFLITSALFSNEGSSPQEFASLQGESSCLIWGCVNPVTGDLVFEQEDVVVNGAEPLPFKRTYISREILNPSLMWDPFKHLKATAVVADNFHFFVTEPSGIVLKYTYFPEISISKGKIYKNVVFPFTIKPNKNQFKAGYIHQIQDDKGNPYNLIENELEFDDQNLTLKLSNGGCRWYERIQAKTAKKHQTLFYLLIKEKLPNGNCIEYEWGDKGLERIKATNPNGKKVYSEIVPIREDTSKKNSFLKITTSSRQFLSYEFKKKDLPKSKNGWFLRSAKTAEFPEERIKRTKKWRLLKERKFPSKRTIEFAYDKTNRVKEMWGPEGEWCLIDYMLDTTIVQDCEGNQTFYSFDRNTLRLKEISSGKKREQFEWTNEGHLLSKKIVGPDSSFNIFYSYDDRHNPISKTFEGAISQENQQESYTIRYLYDEKNRLLEEKEDNGKNIQYTYLNDTNLPNRKLEKKDDIVLKETTLEYDEDNILIREIITAAGERHVKQIQPKKETPFIGLPEIIEERYGLEEILLKKTILTYDQYGKSQFYY